MTPAPSPLPAGRIDGLLRNNDVVMAAWLERWNLGQTLRQAGIIVLGAGAFGAAMGSWRAPEQALWSGLKLPGILLATSAGNVLINGMLAPLLGIRLRLHAATAAVLTSFSLAALMLGAFSPLMLFLSWNLPPPVPGVAVTVAARSVMLLSLVGMVAFAGVTANVRLLGLIRRLAPGRSAALLLLFSWLTVNLLVGSQLSWIARPFIGKADIPVRFLDPHAFEGSFFEELAHTAGELWTHFFP